MNYIDMRRGIFTPPFDNNKTTLIKIKRLEECNMVNDVVESIRDMNLIITESMLDVYDALNDFDNKRQFMYDYENDVEFSDTYLEEFNETLSDNVVMESASATPNTSAFDKQRYQTYRFDFIRQGRRS